MPTRVPPSHARREAIEHAGLDDQEQALFRRSLMQIDSWDFDVRIVSGAIFCHRNALTSPCPPGCVVVEQVFLVDRISRGKVLEHVAKLLFHKRNLEER